MRKKVVLYLTLCFALLVTSFVYASESGISSDFYYDIASFSVNDDECYVENRLIIDFNTLHSVSFHERIQDDEELLTQFLEAQIIADRQFPATRAYSDLMFAFMNDYGDFVYPEHYAGAFLDYDTLIIQVTDKCPYVIAFYTNLLGPDAPIAFRQVTFSFNQLRVYGEMFVNSINAPITSFGQDTRGNTFRIGLYQNSADSTQMIESFNVMSRFAPLPITFEMETFKTPQDLRGGSGLRRGTGQGTGQFSVGSTGTWVGIDALITTGHAFIGHPVNTPVYIPGGTRIGYLHLFRVGDYRVGVTGSTHGDWAIVRLNAAGSSMMTHLIRNGAGIWGITPFVPVGTLVHGSGMNSFAWAGEVSAVNQTVYASIIYTRITGLTRADRGGETAPVPGDSGGTIDLGGFTPYFTGVLATIGYRWQILPLPRRIFHFHFSPVGHASHFLPTSRS